MTRMNFAEKLMEMYACPEAIEWVEDRSLSKAWRACQNPEWMMWLLEEMTCTRGWPTNTKVMKVDDACIDLEDAYVVTQPESDYQLGDWNKLPPKIQRKLCITIRKMVKIGRM